MCSGIVMDDIFSGFNTDNPAVFIAKGKDPYTNTIEVLSKIDLSPARGKKVLLKPNAGRIDIPSSGIITNPQVVAGAIDSFKQAGAEVAVGESPITGVKAFDAFEASGIAAVCRERQCPMIDLDVRWPVEKDIPGGIAIRKIKACADIFDFDFIVSIPVMKMHMHTGVTLSIKNLKGCLWRRSKVELHMLPEVEGSDEKPLNIAITDMSSILRPHLAIIDGTVGMEGLGPSAGEPKELGLVLAGTNGFAADAVACRLMGTSADNIPYLRLAAQRGYGPIDLKKISIFPENWETFISPFASSPDIISIDYPNIEIHDKNSCSACQSTILLFLKRYGNIIFDYFDSDEILHIAIGKGHDDVPDKCLCVGNCTRAHKEKGKFVPGCPPVGSAILKKLTGMTHLPGEIINT
ncbi:MAG: DUF362 domain-containing protein [Chitinivibrionales bacterium]|nr:DUF362 domain-containing protein [Chitinivibrionales bacterium]